MKNRTTAVQTSQIIMEELNYELYHKVYASFIKNKNLPYREFIKSINEELGKDYNRESLTNIIKLSTTVLSPDHAKKMAIILRYTIAKHNGNIDLIRELKETVDNINFTQKISASFLTPCKNNFEKQNDMHEEMIDNLKKEINESIKSKNNNSNLLAKTKKNLRDIDNETYLNYIINRFDINKISLKEVDELLEIINFFMINLEKNINIFKSFNPYTDKDQIINFLSYKDEVEKYRSISVFYSYKLKKLESLYDAYVDLYSSIKSFRDNKTFEEFNRINNSSRDRIKNEEIIYDFYKEIETISSIFNRNIASLNTVSEERIEELKKSFTKKLILENNN